MHEVNKLLIEVSRDGGKKGYLTNGTILKNQVPRFDRVDLILQPQLANHIYAKQHICPLCVIRRCFFIANHTIRVLEKNEFVSSNPKGFSNLFPSFSNCPWENLSEVSP